jgi:hypothetical protein
MYVVVHRFPAAVDVKLNGDLSWRVKHTELNRFRWRPVHLPRHVPVLFCIFYIRWRPIKASDVPYYGCIRCTVLRLAAWRSPEVQMTCADRPGGPPLQLGSVQGADLSGSATDVASCTKK